MRRPRLMAVSGAGLAGSRYGRGVSASPLTHSMRRDDSDFVVFGFTQAGRRTSLRSPLRWGSLLTGSRG